MLIDKLLDYVKYDTQSNEQSETCPSTDKQLVLAKHLYEQLNDLGVADVVCDGYGYVYGYLDGDHNLPTIGLVAHMDTSDAASGYNVNPRIIENYDGNDIKLNDTITTDTNRFPFLKDYKGKTIVVTDGNTLLGADDKAGIAIVMEVLETLINNPNYKHGPIRVAFTPDEEIGRGTEKFNYDLFKVDFAYTVDGDKPNNVEYENFNGASAVVKCTGISVHPGSAKDKLVNAISLAMEFNSYLDPNKVPEHTEGYEGFNHMVGISGEVGQAQLTYILRNHDINILNEQKQSFKDIEAKMNDKYGYKCIETTIIDAYKNMKEKFIGNMYPINLVHQAMNELGMNFTSVAIRGGTDGATLTWNGILCPNLGTGGQNFHGIHEFWCKEDGEKVVELILKLLEIVDPNYNNICPVCNSHHFTEPHEICPICGWQNDKVQKQDPDFEGGANKLSLKQAICEYEKVSK